MNNLELEQRLIEKIRQMSIQRILEVEDFIDFLNSRDRDSTQQHRTISQSVSHSKKRKLSEFKGIVKYPFVGEDAQTWVSHNRQLSDAQRDRQLRDSHES
jgi:hypothetical protein